MSYAQIGAPYKVDGQWRIDVTYPGRRPFVLWRVLGLAKETPDRVVSYAVASPAGMVWRRYKCGQRAELEIRLDEYLRRHQFALGQERK